MASEFFYVLGSPSTKIFHCIAACDLPKQLYFCSRDKTTVSEDHLVNSIESSIDEVFRFKSRGSLSGVIVIGICKSSTKERAVAFKRTLDGYANWQLNTLMKKLDSLEDGGNNGSNLNVIRTNVIKMFSVTAKMAANVESWENYLPDLRSQNTLQSDDRLEKFKAEFVRLCSVTTKGDEIDETQHRQKRQSKKINIPNITDGDSTGNHSSVIHNKPSADEEAKSSTKQSNASVTQLHDDKRTRSGSSYAALKNKAGRRSDEADDSLTGLLEIPAADEQCLEEKTNRKTAVTETKRHKKAANKAPFPEIGQNNKTNAAEVLATSHLETAKNKEDGNSIEDGFGSGKRNGNGNKMQVKPGESFLFDKSTIGNADRFVNVGNGKEVASTCYSPLSPPFTAQTSAMLVDSSSSSSSSARNSAVSSAVTVNSTRVGLNCRVAGEENKLRAEKRTQIGGTSSRGEKITHSGSCSSKSGHFSGQNVKNNAGPNHSLEVERTFVLFAFEDEGKWEIQSEVLSSDYYSLKLARLTDADVYQLVLGKTSREVLRLSESGEQTHVILLAANSDKQKIAELQIKAMKHKIAMEKEDFDFSTCMCLLTDYVDNLRSESNTHLKEIANHDEADENEEAAESPWWLLLENPGDAVKPNKESFKTPQKRDRDNAAYEKVAASDDETSISPEPAEIQLDYELEGVVNKSGARKTYTAARRVTGYMCSTDIKSPFIGTNPTVVGETTGYYYLTVKISISDSWVIAVADTDVSESIEHISAKEPVTVAELDLVIAQWNVPSFFVNCNGKSHACLVVEKVEAGELTERLAQIRPMMNGLWEEGGKINGRAYYARTILRDMYMIADPNYSPELATDSASKGAKIRSDASRAHYKKGRRTMAVRAITYTSREMKDAHALGEAYLVDARGRTKVGDCYINTCAAMETLEDVRELTLRKLEGPRMKKLQNKIAEKNKLNSEIERMHRATAAGNKLLGRTIRSLVSFHQLTEYRWRSEVIKEDMKRSAGTKLMPKEKKLMIVSSYRYLEASVNNAVVKYNERRLNPDDFAVTLKLSQAQIDEKLQRYLWDIRARVAKRQPLDDYTVGSDEEAEQCALENSVSLPMKKKLVSYEKSISLRTLEKLVDEVDGHLTGVAVSKAERHEFTKKQRKERIENPQIAV